MKRNNYGYKVDYSAVANNADSVNTSVPFSVVEAYKSIRTNLMYLLSQTKNKAFVVSSSLPGEGKSTCAINLAIAFSQLGSRVLLIDADLRKPSIYRKMRLQNIKGLSSVLVGFCEFDEAVCKIDDNLDVLLSGPIPPNPSELVASENMTKLLETLSEQYDYILIDTPPVNLVSDAVLLSQKTGGVLFVVQDRKTTHDEFKKAVNQLKFAEVRLLGVALNGSSEKSAKYPSKAQIYQY